MSMDRGSKLNLTATQMESLIETMMWFWGNLHQRWRFAAEQELGLATTEKIEKLFIGDIGRSHGRGFKKVLNTGKGIAGLMEAFRYLPENFVEPFEIVEQSETHLVVQNLSCTVQKARLKSGKEEYPCKEVAILYFTNFTREIDPDIQMTCMICPPDEGNHCTCRWRFDLSEKA